MIIKNELDWRKVENDVIVNNLATLVYDILANTNTHAKEALDLLIKEVSVDEQAKVITLILDLVDNDFDADRGIRKDVIVEISIGEVEEIDD